MPGIAGIICRQPSDLRQRLVQTMGVYAEKSLPLFAWLKPVSAQNLLDNHLAGRQINHNQLQSLAMLEPWMAGMNGPTGAGSSRERRPRPRKSSARGDAIALLQDYDPTPNTAFPRQTRQCP
jgi:hypothetical protein